MLARFRTTPPRKRPRREFGRFKAQQAVLPQPFDEHFAQALGELKQIESQAKAAKQQATGNAAPKKNAAKQPTGKKRSDD